MTIPSPSERASAEVGDGREWHQYEHSGAYLHGEGAEEYVTEEVIEEEEPRAFGSWLPTCAVVAGGLVALIAYCGWQLAHHARHAAGSGAGHFGHNSGAAFAYIVAGVVVYLGLRFVTSAFRKD